MALAAVAILLVPGAALAGGYCADHRAVFRGHAFAGVNDIAFVAGGDAYRNCTAGRFAADGIGWYRYPLTWAAVEPRPGVFDFSTYDALVALLAAHHVRYLPVLLQAPAWAAASGPLPNPTDIRAPAHPARFAAFAAAVVRRYGPHGSFWSEHPRLYRLPIRAWQIWNEPNLPAYWAPHPSPAAYTALLEAADRAIKRVDPHADVVTAGMPYFGPELSAAAFYTAMLRDGAARWFDTFALHPYAATGAGAAQRSLAIRTLMNRHGAARKPMWITELGWASGGPPGPYTARGPAGQARQLATALRLLGADRRRLRLIGLMAWSWRDQPVGEASIDYWGLHCGLYTLGLRPKPALAVFTRFARRTAR